jgi:excisionase family DNA binding protein
VSFDFREFRHLERRFPFIIHELKILGGFGMKNAVNHCKVWPKGWKVMLRGTEDVVLTTQEACDYLRISRPTYLKYLYGGRIRGVKVGKGWKVLKSELDRFLKGEYIDSFRQVGREVW